MKEYSLKIEDMGCDHCIKAVFKALNEVGGLHNVKVSLGSAQFEADNVDQQVVIAAIDEVGYTATFVV
jgi:copper chaperone CopZ